MAENVLRWIQDIKKAPTMLVGEKSNKVDILTRLLASILGYTVWICCKSGKDRTTVENLTFQVFLPILIRDDIEFDNMSYSQFFHLPKTNLKVKADAQEIARNNDIAEITTKNTSWPGNKNFDSSWWLLNMIGFRHTETFSGLSWRAKS